MPANMNNLIKSLKILPWTFRQPLTVQPKQSGTPISDLFFWIRNDEFEVFFELLNLDYLFGVMEKTQVEIVFFNKDGEVFFEKNIELLSGYRQRLNITELLDHGCGSSISGDYGTFAIFHLSTPQIVREMNAFIAERGYISYRYKKSPITMYVHGNYDAIGKVESGYIPLGGASFLKRIYNLQYQFSPENKYRIVLINPCEKVKKLSIKTTSLIDGRKIRENVFKINPRGTLYLDLEQFSEPFRISIEGRVVMARPIIFSFKEREMDVFHG